MSKIQKPTEPAPSLKPEAPLAPEPYQKLFQQGVQTVGESVLLDPNRRTVRPAG